MKAKKIKNPYYAAIEIRLEQKEEVELLINLFKSICSGKIELLDFISSTDINTRNTVLFNINETYQKLINISDYSNNFKMFDIRRVIFDKNMVKTIRKQGIYINKMGTVKFVKPNITFDKFKEIMRKLDIKPQNVAFDKSIFYKE
jgi:hypothetical protein